MNNRHPSSPILLAAVLSFIVSPLVLSQAEPGVPSATTSTNTPTAALPVATPPPAAASEPTTTAAPATYTVVKGDSLWAIGQKFNCSIKSLKKLNHLTKNNLKLGQVLKIPSTADGKSTTPPAPAAATKPDAAIPQAKPPGHHKMYAKAQPVQDFDVPASTFASCPVPLPSPEDDPPAPVAQLVTPSELAASSPTQSTTTTSVTTPAVVDVVAAPAPIKQPAAATPVDSSSSMEDSRLLSFTPHSSKQASRSFISNSNPYFTATSNDWATRFLQEARELGDRGIEYDENWRPPGESQSWAMDCSNTARYLYKVTTGITLPRTASDQYFSLHQQNKAWDVPQTSSGYADCNFLRENLKPGDLLFWENTYRPERQPPITHVMIFLGSNDKGEWIMAGSQTSRGGEHNRRNGGPDIYVFDPNKPCGGYTTWLGLVHHQGRFCAYGRPLEADPAKLAVATN